MKRLARFGHNSLVAAALSTLAAAAALLVAATAVEAVELTIMVFDDAKWLAYHEAAVAEYMQQTPGVNVTVVPGTGDKLRLAVAGGTPVDAFYQAGSSFTALAHQGLFLDLEPIIAQDPSLNLDEFFPSAVDAHRYRGVLYGLPQTVSPVLLLYNRYLFDQAGAAYPDERWTWRDVVESGRKLTRDLDNDGTIDQYAWSYATYSGYNRWPMYVWQNGGDVFSEDGRRLVLDRSEAIEALDFFRDLGRVHRVAPLPNDPILQRYSYLDLFNHGAAAMVTNTRYYNPPDELDWGLTLVPAGKQAATTLITNYYAIVAASQQVPEAWQLIRHLLTVSARRELLRSAHPAVPAFRANAVQLIQAEMERLPHEHLWLDAMESARSPYYPPFSEWQSIVNKHFGPWGNGETSTEAMVHQLVQEASAFLAGLE